MGKRGRPSTKVDFSNINYRKLFFQDIEKIILEAFKRSPKGLCIKNLLDKTINFHGTIKRVLASLLEKKEIVGPYHGYYFHKKWIDKHNAKKQGGTK